MPSGPLHKVDRFALDLGSKVHDFGSDALKVYLSDVAPSAATTAFGTPPEIAAGNGYPAGGAALTGVTWTRSGGVATLAADTLSVTASGGSFGPFRYAVLYNATAAGNPVVGWWDYGSEVTVPVGTPFQITDASGILTIS